MNEIPVNTVNIPADKKAFREDIISYCAEVYSVSPDYPWADSPDNAVLRHTDNKKWFALIMKISPEKIGAVSSEEKIWVMNIKCDPLMTGSLILDEGIFPAYHMNKKSWITLALDGRLDMSKVCALLDMSFELTAPKIKKAKKAKSTKPHNLR